MQLNEAFKIVEKNLSGINTELGIKKTEETDSSITFGGEKGVYRLSHDG